MTPEARVCSVEEILPMRELYREEMNCQITHDSIPRRAGWVVPYLLTLNGASVGYALLAVGGPWTDKPTVIEYYVAQEYRTRVFDLFRSVRCGQWRPIHRDPDERDAANCHAASLVA